MFHSLSCSFYVPPPCASINVVKTSRNGKTGWGSNIKTINIDNRKWLTSTSFWSQRNIKIEKVHGHSSSFFWGWGGGGFLFSTLSLCCPHVFGNPVILLIWHRCLRRRKILNIVWWQALLLNRLLLNLTLIFIYAINVNRYFQDSMLIFLRVEKFVDVSQC